MGVSALYTMGAYGNVLEMTNGADFSNERSSDVQPYHLTTKEYDTDIDLYYFGARWYNSASGRWLSREPSGIDGRNLYTFCGNNPVLFFDFDGMSLWSSFDDAAMNFSCGFGDTISFGLTKRARRLITWGGGSIDPKGVECTGGYRVGVGTGLLQGLAMGGVGPLKSGAQGLRALFRDPRQWRSISQAFWRGVGGAKGRHLHHWLIPQKWTFVPQRIRNAGWNTVILSGRFNRWMGFAPKWRFSKHPFHFVGAYGAEWGIKGLIGGLLFAPIKGMGGILGNGCE